MVSQFLKKSMVFIVLSLIGLAFAIGLPLSILQNNGSFEFANKVSIVLVGNSRPEQAFDDSKIADLKNACNSGESYFYNYTKLKKIIKHNPEINSVFIEFSDADINERNNEWIWGFEKMSNFYPAYSPFFDLEDVKFLIRKNQKDFFASLSIAAKKNFVRLILLRFSYLDKIGSFKSQISSIENYSPDFPTGQPKDEDPQISLDNLEYLRKMVDFCKSNRIQVVFIECPVHRSFSPNLEMEKSFPSIRNEKFGDVQFLDLTSFPLEDKDFYDKTHLNKHGALKLSTWFNGLLKNGLLNKTDKETFVKGELEKMTEKN